MCVNGFSPQSLSKGKGTQSAAGRLLTPTPPGPTIPGSKPGRPVPHTASDIQTVFVILQKQPCPADPSWPQQKGPIVSTKNVGLGEERKKVFSQLRPVPGKMFQVIFKDFKSPFPLSVPET